MIQIHTAGGVTVGNDELAVIGRDFQRPGSLEKGWSRLGQFDSLLLKLIARQLMKIQFGLP